MSSERTPVSRIPENPQVLLLLSHFSTRLATVNSSQSSQMHEETVFRNGEQSRPPPLGKNELLDHLSLSMDPLACNAGPKKTSVLTAS